MAEDSFTVNLLPFARLYRAYEQGNVAAAQRWTAYLLVYRETHELREEERNRGMALAHLLSNWQPDCPPVWHTLCQQSQPAEMAQLGVCWRIVLPEVVLNLGHSQIESVVMAGIKLMPLGQQAAQQPILRLCDHYTIKMPHALVAPDGDIGSTTPLAATVSARHETQYFRLFRFQGESWTLINTRCASASAARPASVKPLCWKHYAE